MSTWVLDLGNSRLKLARLDAAGQPGAVTAVDHDGATFDTALDHALPPAGAIAWWCSVAAPGLQDALLARLQAGGVHVQRPAVARAFGGVRIGYADPSRLGLDRALAMVAVRARGAAPALVVGVGTALTVDLLDAGGTHLGGRIAPSPALMRAALHARVRQLPEAGGQPAGFADDTADALASGCQDAALGAIERSQRDAGRRLGATPVTWLHGGGAAALVAHLPGARLAPSLVLEGLAQLARTARDAG